ncbi:MAG: hypothetical protein AMJ56_00295 [Anaerolineae bacterium SG8_19]|nr:MAG: hypothetical protein AMJ56_00295 [Anaerolineae bacterium SG8_19]
MDIQGLINLGLGTIMAGIGWFARQIWEAVAELRKDVKQIEVSMPTHYVRKDEFVDAIREIRQDLDVGFRRIYDKLDGKADK